MAETSAHILLVDDNPERVMYAKDALAQEGILADTGYWRDLSPEKDMPPYDCVILNNTGQGAPAYEQAAFLSDRLPGSSIILVNIEGCPEVFTSAIRRIAISLVSTFS